MILGILPVMVWASPATDQDEAVPEAWLHADFLLLGEVHDNVAGHALRFYWLQQLVQQRRVALALEQFDLGSQTLLDEAIQHWKSSRTPVNAVTSKAIAEAAGFNFKGWKWPLYEPVLNLALQSDLPVVAANLSRAQLGAVMRGARPAPPEPVHWSAVQRESLLQEIREGHCNLMPEDQLPAMVMAQRARDFEMAQAMIAIHQRSGLPVVLLAGNGHLRNDLAVPVWLRQGAPQARVISVAILEKGGPQSFNPESVYNNVYWVQPESRPDPCEALRQRLEKKPD